MNTEDFVKLLSRPESDTLDFKERPYDLSQEYSRVDFVKDVLCMANTPRDEPSFIVFGVKDLPFGEKELVGVTTHLDDATLQQQFNGLVYPTPHFSYEIIKHGGKDFGLISIPVHRIGPCVPVRDHKNILRQYQVYCRRSSMNDIAQPSDLHRIIAWINEGQSLDLSTGNMNHNWNEFVSAVENFTPTRNYVLVTNGLANVSTELAENLALPPWLAVLDFSRTNADVKSLLDAVQIELGRTRALHIVLPGKSTTINPGMSTYWYLARGDQLTDPKLLDQKFADWTRTLKPKLGEFLRRLVAHVPSRPTTFVFAWYGGSDPSFLRSAIEALLETFGHSATVVVLSEGLADVHSIVAELGAATVSLPQFQLLSGFASTWKNRLPEGGARISLISSSGAPIPLLPKDLAWLQEELEIVHDAIGSVRPYEDNVDRPFLRGAQISWYELGLHVDVERDLSGKLEALIRSDLTDRRATRINLYHAPGAGASCIARRILWSFRKQYPCVVLHRTTTLETVERLSFIHSTSSSPILLLVDGGDIAERDLNDLFGLVGSRHLPVIFLQVLRRFRKQNDGRRALYLPQALSKVETLRFSDVLCHASPSRVRDIKALVSSPVVSYHNPFYFGLVAFEEKFQGLENYVRLRTIDLTPVQSRTLVSIAFAHRYSHRPIPAQAFAEIFGVPKNKTILLNNFFSEETLGLLIEESSGRWRTTHHLVASEILEQVLSKGSTDKRLWRHGLADASRKFAELCRGSDTFISEEMVDLVRRAYIYRDNIEILGNEAAGTSRFAQLIEDIPVAEGALEVLRYLTELFPEDPHFWAHLGRYYSIKQNNYEEALRCIDLAIFFSEDDHVLIHMKGMAIRSRLYQGFERRENMANLVLLAKQATETFQRAQTLNSDAEYGFISEAQMLIRLIEYAAGEKQVTPLALASDPNTNPLLREAFDRIEALLATVRKFREGEDDSNYERTCRASLDGLYGNFEVALQTWDSLLSKKDVYLPPIRRQLIWTYLARRNRSWEGLKGKEIERAIELLESNLEEEPFDERNLRLWVQAVRRRSTAPVLEAIVERVAQWKVRTSSLEATYYLYVLYALMAMEGSAASLVNAEKFLEESRQRAGYRRDKAKSFEWVGPGSGIKRLVHHSSLGDWRSDAEFWEKTHLLNALTGRVTKIIGPQSGEVTLNCGLRAFFVPGVGGQVKGRDENQPVNCYIGFSYEGLRAWSVKPIE